MKYCPQQLNFAVFCATLGCGTSREIFDSGLSLYTTTDKGFLSVSRVFYSEVDSVPATPTFNPLSNHDVASYKRICAEFGIDPSSDFQFTHGKNNGLGNVYVYAQGVTKTEHEYPGWNKFSDEGGKAFKGDLIYYVEPDEKAATQYDWFAPKRTAGLTQPGLSRINQSMEPFVYCILGAQVNVRRSILGVGPCRMPWSLADAIKNDNQHGKHSWLQQQAKASKCRNEARC